MEVTAAVLAAAVLASLCGAAIMFVGVTALDSGRFDEILLFPAAVPMIAFFAFLIVLPGLLVFGVPLSFLLRQWADAPWMLLASMTIGAAAGAVVAVLLLGDLLQPSLLFGACAGFFWFRLIRPAMNRLQET